MKTKTTRSNQMKEGAPIRAEGESVISLASAILRKVRGRYRRLTVRARGSRIMARDASGKEHEVVAGLHVLPVLRARIRVMAPRVGIEPVPSGKVCRGTIPKHPEADYRKGPFRLAVRAKSFTVAAA